MSNSIQDQNMAETKANDTPVETPIEKGKGKAAAVQTHEDEEDHSFVRDAAATLVVVYGGETVTGEQHM